MLNRVREFLDGGGVAAVPGDGAAPGPAAIAVGDPPALSTVHIGPFVEYWDGGGVAKVKIPGSGKGKGGKRGAITSFSSASARRMAYFIQSVNHDLVKGGELVFMTLTYPGQGWPGPRESKELDLKAFKKRFERAWGPHPAIWKLEPQERGAPHFHLLIWIGPGIDARKLAYWTARNWNDLLKGGSDHLRFHLGLLRDSRPCVEVVRDWNGVAAYCAERYMGKPIDGTPWAKPGRWWGKWREDLWPRTRQMWRVTEAAAFVIKRWMRRYYEHVPTGMYRVEFGVKCRDSQSEVVVPPPELAEQGYRQVIVNPGVDRRRLNPREVEVLKMAGVDVRPIGRRWSRSSGGMSVFIKVDDFRRLLVGALQNVPGNDFDILGRPKVWCYLDDERLPEVKAAAEVSVSGEVQLHLW